MSEAADENPKLETTKHSIMSEAICSLFKEITSAELQDIERPRLPESFEGEKTIDDKLIAPFLTKFKEFTSIEIGLVIEIIEALLFEWDPTWHWFLQAILATLRQLQAKKAASEKPAT